MSIAAFIKRVFVGGSVVKPDYASRSDEQLHGLWKDRWNLTPAALVLLREEVSRREKAREARIQMEARTAGVPDRIARLVELVVTTNLHDSNVASLSRGWDILISPVWEPGPNGRAIRRAVLLTRSMRAHYYEGDARLALTSPEIGRAIQSLAKRNDAQLPLGDLRNLYCDEEAPYVALEDEWSPEVGRISLLLADAARRARVGITLTELCDPESDQHHGIAKIISFEESYMAAMMTAPVDELLRLTSSARFVRRPSTHS